MKIDFKKYSDGLVPAVVQDYKTNKVLMLGFMNEEALQKTEQTGLVSFYSRSKKRLWTKGELLIKAEPTGPVCHTGADTCWSERNHKDDFLNYLEDIIRLRRTSNDDTSYVKKLFGKGLNKIAQKVGEEAVELVIEAKDVNRELFLAESADLLFHYLILLQAKDCSLTDVVEVLKQRHQPK
jgi:phosphoribosyl-ATP pyrophosphohydrolase/phosphoribosyl-AMP cyclohydrolase